jgi:ribonuclease III
VSANRRSLATDSPVLLQELLGDLPQDLATAVFTHASWTARRSESYERLAFLGDSVLSLAVTSHLYPRLEAERFGPGRLTKIRAQAVSGRSCREVADRLGVPERLSAAAPAGMASTVPALVSTERVLASVIEAVIGACFLAYGYERTAEAVVEAFTPEIEEALEHPVDFKSALQELLARRGEEVDYEVAAEEGPPHERTYTVIARVDGRRLGSGRGRSKKHAEQEAAREAVEQIGA